MYLGRHGLRRTALGGCKQETTHSAHRTIRKDDTEEPAPSKFSERIRQPEMSVAISRLNPPCKEGGIWTGYSCRKGSLAFRQSGACFGEVVVDLKGSKALKTRCGYSSITGEKLSMSHLRSETPHLFVSFNWKESLCKVPRRPADGSLLLFRSAGQLRQSPSGHVLLFGCICRDDAVLKFLQHGTFICSFVGSSS